MSSSKTDNPQKVTDEFTVRVHRAIKSQPIGQEYSETIGIQSTP